MEARSIVQDLILVALPGGGQRAARSNAWAGMAANATRGRAVREAEAAIALALLRDAEQRDAEQRTGT